MVKTVKYVIIGLFVFLLKITNAQSDSLMWQSEMKGSEKERKISYSFINEYGGHVGVSFNGGPYGDLTGIFVNSICFNQKQDMIGIGVGCDLLDAVFGVSFPIFVNYRHYFPSKRNIKPLVNAALGTKINIWGEADLYSTIAGGFKVKAFSFTAGVCIETWGFPHNFFGGVEIKAGYTFPKK
jgi:hypothetical protein